MVAAAAAGSAPIVKAIATPQATRLVRHFPKPIMASPFPIARDATDYANLSCGNQSAAATAVVQRRRLPRSDAGGGGSALEQPQDSSQKP
jgi:hypothetical protein